MDDRLMERFSRLETAVEAVDFELERMGRSAVASARSVTVCSGLEWSRRAAVPSWWPAASAATPGKPNR